VAGRFCTVVVVREPWELEHDSGAYLSGCPLHSVGDGGLEMPRQR
jgi:hypothetical protein